MSLMYWMIEYRKYDLSEIRYNKFKSFCTVVKGAYQTRLKEEFDKMRDKETIMVGPNIEAGEVMAFKSAHYRHTFVIWHISDSPILLSEDDPTTFTKLVFDCQKFENDYLIRQQLH